METLNSPTNYQDGFRFFLGWLYRSQQAVEFLLSCKGAYST